MDAREKPVAKAQHSSDSTVFGRRAYFRTEFQNPAILVIKDIKRHDAATYRCRVDFRKGQTRSFRYSLVVIGKIYCTLAFRLLLRRELKRVKITEEDEIKFLVEKWRAFPFERVFNRDERRREKRRQTNLVGLKSWLISFRRK